MLQDLERNKCVAPTDVSLLCAVSAEPNRPTASAKKGRKRGQCSPQTTSGTDRVAVDVDKNNVAALACEALSDTVSHGPDGTAACDQRPAARQ